MLHTYTDPNPMKCPEIDKTIWWLDLECHSVEYVIHSLGDQPEL